MLFSEVRTDVPSHPAPLPARAKPSCRRTTYNIEADLPVPLPPPLHPATREPIGPETSAPLFPMELIVQEVSHRALHRDSRARCARCIAIYRPSPLHPRARPRAGARHAGAHLLQVRGRLARPAPTSRTRRSRRRTTTARRGSRKLATETGAGQWGSALAFAACHVRPRRAGLHGARSATTRSRTAAR